MHGIATVEPGLQPWFLGNLLLGGILGIIVDAASGAVSLYPSSTNVVLQPVAAGPLPTASTQPSPSAPVGKPMS